MLFKKKIVFTEGMNETLCSFDEIPWFSCCGVPYDKPSYYPYLQEKDPKRAEKLLLHTKNYSGTDIYKDGHIVLGWSGRFASHETNLENENGVPILPTDGSLIIW